MPRLSVVITTVLVLLVLTAVALWTRLSERRGFERSATFTPVLSVSTASGRPVCVILECTLPDGTAQQLGWAQLGNVPGQTSHTVIVPPGATLRVRWAVGKSITSLSLLPPPDPRFLGGGPVQVGQSVAFVDDPTETESIVGSMSLSAGATFHLRVDGRAARVISSSPLLPPPPPPPPPPPSSDAPDGSAG